MNSDSANKKPPVCFPFNEKATKANERSVRCYVLSKFVEGRPCTKQSPNDNVEIVGNDSGMDSPTNLQTLQTINTMWMGAAGAHVGGSK